MNAPVKSRLAEVLADSSAAFAFAFGSRVRGDHRPDSDLDIAIMLDGDLSLLQRSALAGRLADAAGLPEVDLVILGDACLELKARTLREGELLYSRDEPGRVAFQVRTFSEFFDFEPVLKRHQARLIHQFAGQGLQ